MGDWIEITITVDPVAHDAISAFLFEQGATGLVTEDSPLPSITAYFQADRGFEPLLRRVTWFLRDLDQVFRGLGAFEVTHKRIEDQDWSITWRSFFFTQQVTPGLTIVPAWEPLPTKNSGAMIRIDPGPAFGTGQHATTRMCLRALEVIRPKGSFLDVGTGSGILAMYGKVLGADPVVAIDIDAEAVRWASENIALNGFSGLIDLSLRSPEEVQGSFSVVVANLILSQIIPLLPHLYRLVEPGGWLILSGLLQDQIHELKDHLVLSCSLSSQVMIEGEWATMIFRKGPRG